MPKAKRSITVEEYEALDAKFGEDKRRFRVVGAVNETGWPIGDILKTDSIDAIVRQGITVNIKPGKRGGR